MYEFADWNYWSSGAYNYVYKSKDGARVLKITIPPRESTNLPERSVRIWNELNPTRPASAIEITDIRGMSHTAWVCPFIEGRKSTDDEIFALIVRIFNTTGRIIADGYNASNFITTPSGEVICIDVGFALELDEPRSGRRFSETSSHAWSQLKPLFVDSFERCEDQLPKSTLLVKSLLFIKEHRPDLRNVSFFFFPNEALEIKLKLATKRSPKPSALQIRQALEALDIAAATLLATRPLETGGECAVATSSAGAAGGAGSGAGAGDTAGTVAISAEFLRGSSIFVVREGKEAETHKPLCLKLG